MRERLIGATIVVIAIVVIVPWLVSRSHRPREVTKNMPVPGVAAATSAGTVVVKAYPSVAAEALAQTSETVSGGQEATAGPANSAELQTGTSRVHGHSGDATSATSRIGPLVKPIQHQPTVSSRPPVKPVTASAPQPASSAEWVIQVASFGERGSATALVGRLSKLGYHSYIAPNRVRGHQFYQVRVGPYSQRKRLESAQHRLEEVVHGKALVLRVGASGK